jgi:hypothetical protein
MIMLVCPCGHSTPFPEFTGSYRCTKCGHVTPVTWIDGPDALGNWHRWRNFSGRAATLRETREEKNFAVTSQQKQPFSSGNPAR